MTTKSTEINDYAKKHGVCYQRAHYLLRKRPKVIRRFDEDRIKPVLDRLSKVNEIDWARLASFIDGEGTITISGKSRGHLNIRMSVSNTDARLMLWLRSNFCGTVTPVESQGPNCKPSFIWTVGTRHGELLLKRIRPYLIMKGEQADIALEFRKTIRFGRNQEERLTDDEVGYRQLLKDNILYLNKRGVL